MSIVWPRRISQCFFLALFGWFCVVLTPGSQWHQWDGWPYNLLLQLDPLVAVATILTTGALFAGLAWSLVTLLLTFLFGRVFCGWICPFGTLHQIIGWLARRALPRRLDRIRVNRPHPAQSVKYHLLAFFLALAAGAALHRIGASAGLQSAAPFLLISGGIAFAGLWFLPRGGKIRRTCGFAAWILLTAGVTPSAGPLMAGTVQTGWLDPIPLMHRSVQIALLPLADHANGILFSTPRHYLGAGGIALFFFAMLALNLWIPRFYCRFLCPLGALLGACAPMALFRPGKTRDECSHCKRCEEHCEGACDPDGELRKAECVACMNCLRACPDGVMTFAPRPSASGEQRAPDVGRRGVLAALGAGFLAPVAARLEGWTGDAWRWRVVRPPGTLREPEFLERCIKCGQCMRVCPTNIIHPAGMEAGLEGVWTPVLNFRIGSSGCQLDCVACGQACPTAAIRPITVDEKLGRKDFSDAGPIRLGTAFVDQGRCLPWSMDLPCIVCQENCPVRPKAIRLRQEYRPVRRGNFTASRIEGDTIHADGGEWQPNEWATGDYYAKAQTRNTSPIAITKNTGSSLTLAEKVTWDQEEDVAIVIRLQLPYVDPRQCIGCGICEHECPVAGLRAIRVTAENESRDAHHSLLSGGRSSASGGGQGGGRRGGGGGRGRRGGRS